ncbi:hypothetical protein PCASD_25437 [Puccinia coronata f. sp. avenae]|uniref:Chaperone DnaJ C-terminal domain-containing protein n=1 Tax=Puccinia coronata f. sp. avenae TaxID=200324 RepID=A0A2N5THG6_9BASI|nr:hypothetical protein PCASD_25437 [Puccinia coronata f. sp. avenae]
MEYLIAEKICLISTCSDQGSSGSHFDWEGRFAKAVLPRKPLFGIDSSKMPEKGDKGADKKNHEDAEEQFERLFGTTFGSGEADRERARRRGLENAFQLDDMANALGGVFGDGQLGGGDRNGLGFGSRRADHHSRELALHPPPQDTVRTLRLSLEELFVGGVKRIHLNRKLRNGQSELITRDLTVKAGWKAGTKIRYEGLGDEDKYGRAEGLVLVVEERPHERFQREGDDLVYTHVVPLREALAGAEPAHDLNRSLVHLDGGGCSSSSRWSTRPAGDPSRPASKSSSRIAACLSSEKMGALDPQAISRLSSPSNSLRGWTQTNYWPPASSSKPCSRSIQSIPHVRLHIGSKMTNQSTVPTISFLFPSPLQFLTIQTAHQDKTRWELVYASHLPASRFVFSSHGLVEMAKKWIAE